jgi:hypothetical protein
MSLLPDTATFHEQVQACFVAYRGRGVALSGADLEVLDAWAEAGVPFEVVARGIRKAAEAALWDAPEGDGQLRSLRACRRAVDTEIARYLQRAAGQTERAEAAAEAPFHVVRHQKLRAALRRLSKEHPALKGLLDRLREPADFVEANRQEELALAVLARALPGPDRRALLREAARLVENAQVASRSARRESLRFHRAALVRHRLGLPTFW